MELQGTEESIDAVLLAIERGVYVRIEELDVRPLPPIPDERGFHSR